MLNDDTWQQRSVELDRKMVRVTWTDAYAGTDHWTPIADIENEARIIQSIGYLVHGKVDQHIVIAQSIDGDTVDNTLVIPLMMVQTVDKLRVRGQ